MSMYKHVLYAWLFIIALAIGEAALFVATNENSQFVQLTWTPMLILGIALYGEYRRSKA